MPGQLVFPTPNSFKSPFRKSDGSYDWEAECNFAWDLIDRALLCIYVRSQPILIPFRFFAQDKRSARLPPSLPSLSSLPEVSWSFLKGTSLDFQPSARKGACSLFSTRRRRAVDELEVRILPPRFP
jgi:hypothetical protein